MFNIQKYHRFNQNIKNINCNKRGIIYLFISAFCFSFSGIFVKSVDASGADIIFWRALFGSLLVLFWINLTSQIKVQLKPTNSMVSIAALAVISTTTFLLSYKYTSVANVAMIYAVTPLVAGMFGWVILSEKFVNRQIIFSLFALIGVSVVMQGSLGSVNIYGDTLAMIMSCTLALIIVLFRKYPHTSSTGVNVYSCSALVIIFYFIGDPLSIPLSEILTLAVFALFFIIAYATLQEGSKLLSPALTSLISVLETPLAPLWAWLILSEIPTLSTIIGGTIILCAVLLAVFDSNN